MVALMMIEPDPLLLVVAKDHILSGGLFWKQALALKSPGQMLLQCSRFSSQLRNSYLLLCLPLELEPINLRLEIRTKQTLLSCTEDVPRGFYMLA